MPLRVARDLLNDIEPGQTLLDPFCGKGTSLLAGAMQRLRVIGADVSPEAVVCSQAKVSGLTAKELVEYVESLDDGSPGPPLPNLLRVFYHPATGRQLMAVREQLLHDLRSSGRRQRLATGTTAALLGILHGKSSISLSLPSAHSFSMAPAYVGTYARKHGLRRPLRNVKACLRAKVAACFSANLPVRGRVYQLSAIDLSKETPHLRGSVDVILTSPPYLNAQTYAKDNWLRLWFLGYDYRELGAQYIETGSVPKYEAKMQSWFIDAAELLRKGGRLIVVAGDVRLRGASRSHLPPYRTGDHLRKIALATGHYRLVKQARHKVPTHARNYHSLSNSNGHKRDLVERLFVMERP